MKETIPFPANRIRGKTISFPGCSRSKGSPISLAEWFAEHYPDETNPYENFDPDTGMHDGYNSNELGC